MMGWFHKHRWSSWVPVKTERVGSYLFAQPPVFWTDRGVMRVCLDCGKEEEHYGDVWREAYKRGELSSECEPKNPPITKEEVTNNE